MQQVLVVSQISALPFYDDALSAIRMVDDSAVAVVLLPRFLTSAVSFQTHI
jgi:dihydroxyacetone kinase